MTTLLCVRRDNFDGLAPLPNVEPLTVRTVRTGEWTTTDQRHWHTLMALAFGRTLDIDTILFHQPILDIQYTHFLMDGRTPVGVMSEGVFRQAPTIGTLHFLGVDPAYGNLGFGKYLLLFGYHHMQAQGLPCFEGETTVEHRRAVYIHLDLGCHIKDRADTWNTPGVAAHPLHDALYKDWLCRHVVPASQKIPLSQPALYEKATTNVLDVLTSHKLSGDGRYTHDCQTWFETQTPCARALLTPSGTAALELAALLADIHPGDEVIMPSFTFATTASAFALRGAIPVFVDIRPDTLNMDERRVEAAITPRTKAIVPVHYGGVICNMTVICDIATRHHLFVIEDGAQALGSDHSTQPYGQMSIYSFHDTKNFVCGEGGALLIHDPTLVDRADILWHCGTDRRQFLEGRVTAYTWQDIGSSFLPSELQAAVLWSQISGDFIENMTQQRQHIWDRYHAAFAYLDIYGRPTTGHNAHVYYLLVPADQRTTMLLRLHRAGIGASFHYMPLHSSPAGRKYGRVSGSMTWTDQLSQQIIRLPLYAGRTGMHDGLVDEVIQQCKHAGL
jgi:dTDP-4-amino-4,6-dideoxygalactose transaminase